ncbi:MAG TPA: glycosyltransferase family 2 protein [Gemmata sp.]|nr:glycosyltransferase family 2 protein [Gemmata sp.]
MPEHRASSEINTRRTFSRFPLNPFSEMIHLLNQRYHDEWARAESLQDELNDMRGSRLWKAVSWLRELKKRLWAIPTAPEPKLIAKAVPYELPEGISRPQGRVSIVIPFKDRPELLRNCLRSLAHTSYRDFEVILVDNGSKERRTKRFLSRNLARGRFVVVDGSGQFNFSRLCNSGAARANGEYLLFLNNDTEVLDPAWLEQLLRPAMDARVGIVAATLLYPNRTIQHAGIFPRDDGLWVHQYRGVPVGHRGENSELLVPRSVPAVTAACLMIRRELFQAMAGFDERYPVTYNDIELCERVRERGLLVVITPHVRLMHYEGLSRGFTCDLPGIEDSK